jgi:hydroxymethylglutaryl-CoA reductase (NADPH)
MKSFNKQKLELAEQSPAELMQARRAHLEKLTKTSLRSISSPSFDISLASTKNCENLIGKTEIPLGFAGPLKVKGDFAKGDFYIPLSTTEGALVASVNRGCKAISKAGGIYVYIEKSGITRAPLFKTNNLRESRQFVTWINLHFKEIATQIENTDKYLKLLSIKPYLTGRNVYLNFTFNTADAMGMNMVTIACDRVIRDYIEKKTKVKCIALSGNLCIDKKPAWKNKIEGRGFSLQADLTIPKGVIKEVLKVDVSRIMDVYTRKVLVGSSLSGSIGFNAHHANIVAAIFLATGQDPAHIVEGSLGTTIMEAIGENLYVSVSIPALIVGTVGGGTQLETQKEALTILGVAGGGNPSGTHAKKLAEIIAAAVAAGEISLISALASSDLARAHKSLGRGEKI